MVALEAGEDADALDALDSLILDEDSEEGAPAAAKAKRKGKVCCHNAHNGLCSCPEASC